MSKANLINSLFKIDAAEGFVRYTNTVKPYHSKILDVMIEYIYKEDVRVKVTESWNTDIHQEKSAYDNCYYRVAGKVLGPAGQWLLMVTQLTWVELTTVWVLATLSILCVLFQC